MTQDNETGLALAPKYDANGLITAVCTDAASGDVLMVAHMNADALAKTLETVWAGQAKPEEVMTKIAEQWQKDLDAGVFRLLFHLESGRHHFVLDQ